MRVAGYRRLIRDTPVDEVYPIRQTTLYGLILAYDTIRRRTEEPKALSNTYNNLSV
jgi:hypothetical protein